MNSDLTESVQASIRPGEMVDTYYYGETNLEKQAYPSVVNTRFVQQFTQLGAGSSQFVISPNMGVSDIVMQFVTPASAGANYTTLALSQGWGYSLISRVSVRYGSSAQYFFSGPQTFLQNLVDAENTTKANDISALGGNAVQGANCGNQAAYVYLKLPHNSVRASGKPLPFPSDLLVQPIVVTVELYALNQILVNQSATPNLNLTNGPAALQTAQFQVKQEMLTDSSDLLARRVDMNAHAYTLPLMYFAQQETQVPVTSPASATDTISVNLTGFRAGEVKSIVLWLTPTAAGQSSAGSGNFQPLTWQAMNQVTLTYNGEIFSRFDGGSAALWNLTSDEKSAYYSQITQTTGSVASSTAPSPWLDCPFAQVCVPYDKEMKLVHGKPILNAVVQLSFQAPATSTNYILHAMYLYNASLLCSRGSAEYIF
jgi:hypothetical protein